MRNPYSVKTCCRKTLIGPKMEQKNN